MKPFDLEAALAGKPVVTRDGRPVKIAGYNPDAKYNFNILGWINGVVKVWDAFGKTAASKHESIYDLFMAPTERTEWVVRCPEYKVMGPFHNKDLAEHWKTQMNRPDCTIHEITIVE